MRGRRSRQRNLALQLLFTVRETILRYRPETLANYAALPLAFRASHPLQDGKTAKRPLAEQLALLDQRLAQIVVNVARGDAQALVIIGRFLRERFLQPDFLAK